MYVNKRKIIDAGFSIYYTAANIGGFMGTLFIGLIAEEFGMIIGLFTTAFCMLTATILTAIAPKILLEQVKQTRPPINNMIAVLTVCFIGIAVFWAFYEFSWFSFLDVQKAVGNLHLSDITLFGLDNIGSIITMLVIAICSVIWSHFYYNQLKKLAVGFLAMAIGLFFASFVGELYTETSTFIILIAMLFIGIAEARIGPIINLVITQSFNPKYLAIIMSLAFIPTVLFGKIISAIKNELHIPKSQTQMFLVGIVGLGFFGLLLLLLVKKGILKLDSP